MVKKESLVDAKIESFYPGGGFLEGIQKTITKNVTNKINSNKTSTTLLDVTMGPAGILNPAANSMYDNIPSYTTDNSTQMICWFTPRHNPGGYTNNMVGNVLLLNQSAANRATALLNRPVGRRCMTLQSIDVTNAWDSMFDDDSDKASFNSKLYRTPFCDSGGPPVARNVKSYFQDLKDAGGVGDDVLDFFVMDIEDVPTSIFFWKMLGNADDIDDALDAYDADPRFNEIKDRFGSTVLQDLKGTTIPLNSQTVKNITGITARWGYMEIAKYLIKPFHQVFPNVPVVQYSAAIKPLALQALELSTPNGNGHVMPDEAVCGDFQCPVLYGTMQNLGSINTPSFMNNGNYDKTAFNVLRLHVNDLKINQRCAPHIREMPYLRERSRSANGAQWHKQPLHADELIRHVRLYGWNAMLYFNKAADSDDDSKYDAILAELTTKFNGELGTPIFLDNMEWTSEFIVSGVKLTDANKTLWRISVDDGVSSVQVNGTDDYIVNTGTERGVWHEDTINLNSISVSDTT